jgi:hypothetical protein
MRKIFGYKEKVSIFAPSFGNDRLYFIDIVDKA